MIITTTSSVEGYRIVRYFPPVVTNVVMGTGLLNDVVAGFTDVFGGKSATYQSYLREMYASATGDLEERATAAGANCLVGVSFDLDQISGRGMQMFMLNAVGSPVIIKTEKEIVEEAAAEAAAREDRERQELARRARFEGVDAIQALLADEEIARQARKSRQMYGRAVAASFLKRKAAELGLGTVDVTEDDIPESF